jgi:hypothetical protein
MKDAAAALMGSGVPKFFTVFLHRLFGRACKEVRFGHSNRTYQLPDCQKIAEAAEPPWDFSDERFSVMHTDQ